MTENPYAHDLADRYACPDHGFDLSEDCRGCWAAEAWIQGIALERARVVADLRSRATRISSHLSEMRTRLDPGTPILQLVAQAIHNLLSLADAYEAGDHEDK